MLKRKRGKILHDLNILERTITADVRSINDCGQVHNNLTKLLKENNRKCNNYKAELSIKQAIQANKQLEFEELIKQIG